MSCKTLVQKAHAIKQNECNQNKRFQAQTDWLLIEIQVVQARTHTHTHTSTLNLDSNHRRLRSGNR